MTNTDDRVRFLENRTEKSMGLGQDDPLSATKDYMSENDRFEIDAELNGKLVLSSSPGGYLRCKY